MKDHRQLLCTFSNSKDFKKTIEDIKEFYRIEDYVRFFVFSNEKNPQEIYITYNINFHCDKSSSKFPNTISIHRKKQTNTLYSLNAMNTLIKEENGSLDKTYILEWELYKNSLIISGDVSVRIISLKLISVI